MHIWIARAHLWTFDCVIYYAINMAIHYYIGIFGKIIMIANGLAWSLRITFVIIETNIYSYLYAHIDNNKSTELRFMVICICDNIPLKHTAIFVHFFVVRWKTYKIAWSKLLYQCMYDENSYYCRFSFFSYSWIDSGEGYGYSWNACMDYRQHFRIRRKKQNYS